MRVIVAQRYGCMGGGGNVQILQFVRETCEIQALAHESTIIYEILLRLLKFPLQSGYAARCAGDIFGRFLLL